MRREELKKKKEKTISSLRQCLIDSNLSFGDSMEVLAVLLSTLLRATGSPAITRATIQKIWLVSHPEQMKKEAKA